MAATADATYTQVIGDKASYPIAAETSMYKAAMVGLDDGYAKLLTDGMRFVGHCVAQILNTAAAGFGTAGDLNVEVLTGKYKLKIALEGVNAYMNGAYVYAYDSSIYSLCPCSVPVGRVVQYVSAGVAVVEFDTNMSRAKMDGLGIFEPFRVVPGMTGAVGAAASVGDAWVRTSVNGPENITLISTNANREGSSYHTGIIIQTDTAENDGENLQVMGEPFYLAETTKPVFFGCKIMASVADENDILAGIAITDTDLAGGVTDGILFTKADGSTDVNLVVEKDSTATTSAAAEHTLVAAAAVTLGFVYDGVAVYPYVNGVRGTGLVVTNLPNDEALTIGLQILAGAAVANYLTVYFVDAYQIVG